MILYDKQIYFAFDDIIEMCMRAIILEIYLS